MAEIILGIVKRLGIFTIAAQTFLHFCPNQKYEKYIKVLIGSMTIVILVVPVLGLFQTGVEDTIWQNIESYGENMERVLLENKVEQETSTAEEIKEEIKTEINKLTKEKGYVVTKIDWREENGRIVLTVCLRTNQAIFIPTIKRKEHEKSDKELELQKLLTQKLEIEDGRLEVRVDE